MRDKTPTFSTAKQKECLFLGAECLFASDTVTFVALMEKRNRLSYVFFFCEKRRRVEVEDMFVVLG